MADRNINENDRSEYQPAGLGFCLCVSGLIVAWLAIMTLILQPLF